MSKKILIVTTQSPYPTHHGGAFDVFEKLIGIKKLGFTIDLVITTKFLIKDDDKLFLKKIVNKLYIVERKNKILDLFSLYPIQYKSRINLKKIVFNDYYNHVLLESEFLSSILLNKTLNYGKLYFRVHNNESYYFRQLAASTNNLIKKIYYLVDSFKINKVTNSLLVKADRIWYISNKEYEESKYKSKAIFLPPPINEKFKINENYSKTVLFVGSLFMENNIQGLDWYLENIHEKLLKKHIDYKLIIAGSSGSIQVNQLKNKYAHLKSVELYLNKKSLADLYDKSSIFINPMFFGSGVKLKSINSIVNGMLLVSTDVGVEGIGLTESMYLKANNKEDFLNQISLAFNNKNKNKMIKDAQEYLKSINYLNILKNELK